MARKLTISEVAAICGCSVHTLRYYERAGLMPPVGRAPNGHRRYDESDCEWVDFLFCLRTTGMPIAGMKRYVDLVAAGDMTAPERLRLLETHAASVAGQVEDLQRKLGALEHKIEGYRTAIHAVIEARRKATAGAVKP